jgi:hypothetical protein
VRGASHNNIEDGWLQPLLAKVGAFVRFCVAKGAQDPSSLASQGALSESKSSQSQEELLLSDIGVE